MFIPDPFIFGQWEDTDVCSDSCQLLQRRTCEEVNPASSCKHMTLERIGETACHRPPCPGSFSSLILSNCIFIPTDLYTLGPWKKPECTESCGSLGVLRKTRTCEPKDATVSCKNAETEKFLGTSCNRVPCPPLMIASGVGVVFVTIMIVFLVRSKRRRKRSNSEGSIERNESIWSTSSVATQKDTQVERPLTGEKPIQKVAPIPRQPEKPQVPARNIGTSEVRKTTPEVQIAASEVVTTTPVLEVEAQIPSHCILRKENHLKNNHKNLAKNEALLYEEFLQISVYVRDHVKKDSNIAKQHEYKLHNRYRDIGRPIWLG